MASKALIILLAVLLVSNILNSSDRKIPGPKATEVAGGEPSPVHGGPNPWGPDPYRHSVGGYATPIQDPWGPDPYRHSVAGYATPIPDPWGPNAWGPDPYSYSVGGYATPIPDPWTPTPWTPPIRDDTRLPSGPRTP